MTYLVKAAVNLLSAVITIPNIIPSDLGSISRQISLVAISNDTNLQTYCKKGLFCCNKRLLGEIKRRHKALKCFL